MNGCESRANVACIQLEHRQYDDFPLVWRSLITNDSYVLFAPVNRARVKVVSDGQVLFEGVTRRGMLRAAEPGEKVRVTVRSPNRHIALTIPGAEMREILERLDNRGRSRTGRIEPLTRPDERVAQAVKASFVVKDFEDSHRQLYVDGLAHLMLACLLNRQTCSAHYRASPRGHALSDSEFGRCCEYADAMMGTKLDLRAWAGVLGMSATEFTKRFQEITRQSPYAWFLTRRVHHAKEMLQDRRNSILDVALALGFCSQSHFTEAFRRRVGCSPGRWKAEMTEHIPIENAPSPGTS